MKQFLIILIIDKLIIFFDKIFESVKFLKFYSLKIYSLIQLVIFGWQTKFVRDIQWQFENRQMPFLG